MSSSEPDIPAAPQQKDTLIYDDEGKLSYSIVNEGGKMVYRPGEKSLSAKAEAAELAQLRKSALGRISATPQEYRDMAQEAADAYASSVQSGVDRQYAKDVARSTEAANIRGLVGSRAWADTNAEMARAKLETDTRTQQQATSMRDQLLQNYQNRDIGLFNLYKSTSDAEWAKMMSQAQFAGGQNLGNYQADISKYGIESQNAMNQWQAEQANDPWNKYIMPTATTAAYAYGLGAFGPAAKAATTKGV